MSARWLVRAIVALVVVRVVLAVFLLTSPLTTQPNASLVLGTSEVSVLDMAGAYSTFADGSQGVFTAAVVAADADADVPWLATAIEAATAGFNRPSVNTTGVRACRSVAMRVSGI